MLYGERWLVEVWEGGEMSLALGGGGGEGKRRRRIWAGMGRTLP